MAHRDGRARKSTMSVVFAALAIWLMATEVFAQVSPPSLVYRTQIYGRGNANSLPAAGDTNLGKNALAVDPAGNVYVTGTTFNGLNSDYLTVKYSPQGTILWRAVANGAGNGNDFAYAIALDAGGNVIVTGSSQASGYSNYLTIKYDASGNEQWRASMDGAMQRDDEAYVVAVDGSGHIFVTGVANAYTGNSDYVTVKYSPAGAELWRMTMDGAGRIDQSVAMCLDNAGNPIVTGYSFNNNLNFDYVTVKYIENSGIPLELWRRSMNGNTSGNDVAFAMACDTTGNAYVTGKSTNAGNNFDYLTVKYSAGGIEQWRAALNGAGNAADTSFAIAVDPAGNVVVSGQSEQDGSGVVSVTNPAHLTVKYNAMGLEQWRVALNGSGTGSDTYSTLTTDAAGNIYTTAFADNNGSNDLLVVKYATGPGASAVEVWRAFVNGAGSANSAALMAINVDSSGNVVVAGYRSNGVDNDFLVVKFDSNGQESWRATEGENTRLTSLYAAGAAGRNALALDGAGNAVVAGQSGLANSSDFVVAKVDRAGVEQWRAVVDGTGGGTDRAYAVATDGSGNVYVAGDSFAAGYSDFLTVRFNSSGVEQWRALAGRAPNTFNTVRALAVDPSGDVIVTGQSSAGADFLTIKYAAGGGELARSTSNGSGSGNDTPVAMAVDATGNIFVTGRSFDGAYDGYLTVKYSPSLLELRRAVIPGSASAPQQPYAIVIDAAGNVIVGGDSLVKYNANLDEQWRVTDSFRAYALAVGVDGSVLVAGTGGLIVKYDAGGSRQWQRAINGAVDGNDVVYTVAVDGAGDVYVAGQNAANVNGDYLTVKFAADGTERWRFTTATAGGGLGVPPVISLGDNRSVMLTGNAVSPGQPTAIMLARFSQAPPPPINVTALAGSELAMVTFQPPAASEAPIADYSIVCQPGNIVASRNTSPIFVTGLTNELPYLCSITASNVYGSSAAVPFSVTPSASAPLALFSVHSRKPHGTAGDYSVDIDLLPSIYGAITVEPRASAAGHVLVFTFNNAVSVAGTASAEDSFMASLPGTFATLAAGNRVEVAMPVIADSTRLVVTLTGVNGTPAVFSASLGLLVGDVTASGLVTAADISAIKSRDGQPLGPLNFQFDVNLSGDISAADVTAAKARAGQTLP